MRDVGAVTSGRSARYKRIDGIAQNGPATDAASLCDAIDLSTDISPEADRHSDGVYQGTSFRLQIGAGSSCARQDLSALLEPASQGGRCEATPQCTKVVQPENRGYLTSC